MIKMILTISSFLVMTSCSNTTATKPQTSAVTIKQTAQVLDEPDDEEMDLGKMRAEYLLSYDQPVESEAFYDGKTGEEIKMLGKYYCLFDSAIVVPGKYNFDDTTKIFQTHNFAQNIMIIINGDTAVNKTITKEVFHGSLPGYLQEYAVMLEPNFRGYDSTNDVFDFSFSISIPLTDVGEARTLSIKRNGEVIVKNID